MSKKGSSHDYAQAIYGIALEGWQNELQSVQSVLGASPDLLKKLSNTNTKFATHQKNLDAALPNDISEQTKNFLYTLLKNGDLEMLGDIATNLTRLATKGPSVEIAVVTTAVELTADEKGQFEAKLASQYGNQVAVDFVIDESILGGVVVQVGDKIIDGSVATKLAAAKNTLAMA